MLISKYADMLRNAMLDAISTTYGTTPKLRLYGGTEPAVEAASVAGNSMLAEFTMALAAASNSSENMIGNTLSTTGAAAVSTGTTVAFCCIWKLCFGISASGKNPVLLARI